MRKLYSAQIATALLLLGSSALAEETSKANEDNAVKDLRRCEAAAPQMPQDAETALAATVLIKTEDGVGSGVIISPDGFVLTAAHVATERKVTATLHGGTETSAELLRMNSVRDVALLQLRGSKKDWPCLTLRETSPKIGEDIYVLGSPGGEELSFSISRGIVSGMRKLEGRDYLQTDAALNPGNSGGPFVGSEGEVRAIASWKVASTDMEGLGFGVPSAIAVAALRLKFSDASAKFTPYRGKLYGEPEPSETVIDEDKYERFESVRVPRWVHPVRYWGFISAVTGVSLLVTNFAVEAASPTSNLEGVEIAGWIATGVGTGMIVATFVFGQPQKQTSQSTQGVEVSVAVAGPGLQVNGSF